MSPDLIWSNVAAYCLQIGLLVGVAGFVPAVLSLAHPRHRLAFWHILLLACLVLPLAAPWRQETIVATPVAAPVPAAAPLAAMPAAPRAIPWNRIVLYALAGGAVLRLLWLAGGLWRLRLYRRRSTPLEPPLSWSVEADLRLSADVASPVTFGARRPVVLLPANFPELDGPTQEAVLCHEIVHVRRKDWLVALTEELVRSVFWFHPAIWWLLGEIGLAREQSVDREVVEMTRLREEYVDALLAIAGAKPRLDLAPAPLFLRRRHLKHRIISIMKEVRMSKARSLSALAASLGILAATCWLVTMTFPLAAAPQMVADGPGVTVDLGNAAIMHRTSVMYPPAARTARVEGTVLVDATLDNAGNVVDARIVSGPVELRRGVLQSVLQWHFSNEGGPATRQIGVTFKVPEIPAPSVAGVPGGAIRRETAPSASAAAPRAGVSGGVIGRVPAGTIVRMNPPFSLEGKALKQIAIVGLTDEAKARLASRLPVHEGEVLTADSYQRTVDAVREYDEHLMVGLKTEADESASFVISAPGVSGSTMLGAYSPLAAVATPASPELPPPAPGVKRITIGGNVQSSKLVQQPRPVYPPLAKQARIMGVVKLQAVINADGTMKNLAVISGHPLLIPAALEAVRQWVYAPTLLNGEPVEVVTQIDVNFTLADQPPPQQ